MGIETHSLSGPRTAALQIIILTCLSTLGPNAPSAPSPDEVPRARTKAYSADLYSTLSNPVQGVPWEGDAVELSDELSPLDRCVMMGLCRDFGLL